MKEINIYEIIEKTLDAQIYEQCLEVEQMLREEVEVFMCGLDYDYLASKGLLLIDNNGEKLYPTYKGYKIRLIRDSYKKGDILTEWESEERYIILDVEYLYDLDDNKIKRVYNYTMLHEDDKIIISEIEQGEDLDLMIRFD